MTDEPLKIFMSYSHLDFEWQRKITAELKLLGINVWVDRQIKPGDSWQKEIEENLAAADIVLLLISRDFLTSDFVTTQELPAALKRVQDEENPPRVIPVLLRECSWGKAFGISEIHAIPRHERWVANIGSEDKYWANEDAAIRAVAKELEETIAVVEQERQERRVKEADYRLRVAEALSDDDEITPYERRSLEEERTRLGLSEAVAREVEASELRRHEAELKSIRAYEADIEFAINDVGLPFDEKTQEELKKRKAKLGLKDDDVIGLVEKVAARVASEKVIREAAADADPQDDEAAESMPVTEVPETIDAPQETAAPEADRAPQPSTAEPAAVSGGQPAEVQDAEQSVAAAADTQEESVADHDHRADEASWVADLKAVLSEVTDLPTTLYVAPDIPKRKTENAYERYGVPIDEPIVGLLDETAMGSAKNGLAFGARRIYIKNAAGSVSSGAHTVEYEDLASWDIEKQSTYEVALGSDLSYNSLSAKQTTPVLLAVQAMIRRRGGVPPSLNASPGAGQPGGGAPVRVTLDVGERVFAQWSGDSFFYPGIIIGIEDTGVSVRFDDGIQESVANSQVAPVDVGVGSRVSARYGGLDAYYPGEIDGRQGETVHIKYDDGDEELTTISMIRLEQR